MLKALLPALLLSGLAATSLAQPTLTASGVSPMVGDKFTINVCDPTGVVQGPSGANQTWTFTSLTTTQTDTGRVTSCVTSTPNCSSFPGSTMVLTGPGITHGKTYITTTSAKRSQIGYYAAADTQLVLSDPMDELHYPFNYGDTYDDPFAGTFTFGPINAHHSGNIHVVADAWGKLILPTRTDDNTMRVYSYQQFKDSAYIFGPIVQVYDVKTYAWYKDGYHSALLTITSVTSVPAGTFAQNFVAYAPTYIADVEAVAKVSLFDLYPNPASDALNVRFSATGNEQVTVSLIDMLGRTELIAAGEYSGMQDISYNTSSLPRGIYIVRLQAGSETMTKKIELQ